MGRDKSVHIPFTSYIKHVVLLPYHFFTQRKYAQCERKRPWAIHLGLVLSYVTMLILIMFFLGFMQSGPDVDWRVHVFGYLATVGLLGSTIFFLTKRLQKTDVQYKQSHETDWIFLVLLILVAFTGILQHILHRSGLDAAANVAYIVHLMGVVPMLALRGSVQQVGTPGLPSAGLVLRGAGRGQAVADESKDPRPSPCRPSRRSVTMDEHQDRRLCMQLRHEHRQGGRLRALWQNPHRTTRSDRSQVRTNTCAPIPARR